MNKDEPVRRIAYIDESASRLIDGKTRYVTSAVLAQVEESVFRSELVQEFPNIVNFKTSDHYRRKSGKPLQMMLETFPKKVIGILSTSVEIDHRKVEYGRSLVLSRLFRELDFLMVDKVVLDTRANGHDRRKNNPDLRDSILLVNHQIEGLVRQRVLIEHKDDKKEPLLVLADIAAWTSNRKLGSQLENRFWNPISRMIKFVEVNAYT